MALVAFLAAVVMGVVWAAVTEVVVVDGAGATGVATDTAQVTAGTAGQRTAVGRATAVAVMVVMAVMVPARTVVNGVIYGRRIAWFIATFVFFTNKFFFVVPLFLVTSKH